MLICFSPGEWNMMFTMWESSIIVMYRALSRKDYMNKQFIFSTRISLKIQLQNLYFLTKRCIFLLVNSNHGNIGRLHLCILITGNNLDLWIHCKVKSYGIKYILDYPTANCMCFENLFWFVISLKKKKRSLHSDDFVTKNIHPSISMYRI